MLLILTKCLSRQAAFFDALGLPHGLAAKCEASTTALQCNTPRHILPRRAVVAESTPNSGTATEEMREQPKVKADPPPSQASISC